MSPEANTPKSHIAKRLQQLTDFVNDPRAPEALARGAVHPARALVLRAVMATPGLPEFLYNRAYTRPYHSAGHEVLGIGYHAVTVTDGPHKVRKFYRHTAGQSEASQQAEVEALREKQNSALTHLGEYAVAQDFFIQEDPLQPQQSIIAASQKRVHVEAGINFYTGAEVPAVDPSAFATSALEMQANSDPRALPDVVGVNNLVVETTTGSLSLIDPIALHASDPMDAPTYERAVQILERVAAGENK